MTIKTPLNDLTRPPQAPLHPPAPSLPRQAPFPKDAPLPEDLAASGLGTRSDAARGKGSVLADPGWAGEMVGGCTEAAGACEPRSNSLPVIFLVGPTAIGKSRVAILVAQALGTEILTADSTQVYRHMDIGTDKPGARDRGAVPHRLIDLVDPDEPFNAGQYRRAALQEIVRLHGDGRLPLVVGGTGLYIRTLAYGLWEGPAADWDLRRQWLAEEAVHGEGYLWKQLAELDPRLAATLHPRDRNKIVRGLEVAVQTGKPLSEWHEGHGFLERPFPSVMVGLMMDRAALYRRIDARVLREIEDGLIEETQRLLDRGYGEHLGSMKALGYRQMTGYLKGRYGYEEAVRRLQRDTRHFAKRQMTWFRGDPNVHWLTLEEEESGEHVAHRVLEYLEHQGISGASGWPE